MQKILSNVGRNMRANCALIVNANISCTQWCLLKNESLKYDSFMYVFLLLARVTLAPHLLYIFSILVDVSCDVWVTPVGIVYSKPCFTQKIWVVRQEIIKFGF